jgi:hypothetical protein
MFNAIINSITTFMTIFDIKADFLSDRDASSSTCHLSIAQSAPDSLIGFLTLTLKFEKSLKREKSPWNPHDAVKLKSL